jgi:hypothetical protein
MADILVAGSTVRVGFVISKGYDYTWIQDQALPAIEGCLYNTGQFEEISFDYTRGDLLSRDYFNIRAITVQDFGQAEDYGGLVAQTIQLCVPDLYAGITRRDPVVIDHVPTDAEGQQGIQQPNAVDSRATGRAPEPPGKCDNLAFFDYLACQTGFTTDGIKLGIPVVAVGGLVLLVLFLRR